MTPKNRKQATHPYETNPPRQQKFPQEREDFTLDTTARPFTDPHISTSAKGLEPEMRPGPVSSDRESFFIRESKSKGR